LFIIGDGPELENLKTFSEKFQVDSIFLGRLEGDELNNTIARNADLAFSMGTSALEFAKLGIPTVLTEGALTLKGDLVSDKTYKWLHLSNDYNLSSEPFLSMQKDIMNLNEIISDFKRSDEFGKLAFKYTYEKHGIEKVFTQINKYLAKNELNYSHLISSGLLQYSFFERSVILFFKIKNVLKSHLLIINK
jgi:hypothetical protein